MGEVVNLRLQRKRAARRAAETEAADNRVAHGMPKAVRQLAERRATMEMTRLDGHRLDEASRKRPDATSDAASPRDGAS